MSSKPINPDLDPQQRDVCFNRGTERPFTGRYHDYKGGGHFHCVNCDAPLFDAATKFDSGTGWPSFYDVIQSGAVALNEDNSHGMQRVETICARCGAHLGHLFPDGPPPTGQRYCINSASLRLEE